MPPLVTAFINPNGRLRRRGWWALQIAITLANFVLLQIVMLVLAGQGDIRIYRWTTIIQLICSLPFLWPGFVIGAKRLHDLGRSAIWIAPFYIYYFADAGSKVYDAVTGTFQGYMKLGNASWDIQLLVYGRWIYFVALIVVFGILPGQRRANRYGPAGGAPAPTTEVFD